MIRERQTARRLTIALLGVGLAASAAAGCGSGGTETVTVPGSSAPSAPGAVRFSGTTEQGLPVSFLATGTSVSDFYFGWRAPCADGQTRTNSISLGGTVLHDGTFSKGGVLETGGVAQVEGQIDGASASGTFSRSRGTSFGVDCKISDVSWSAQAGSAPGGAETGTDQAL